MFAYRHTPAVCAESTANDLEDPETSHRNHMEYFLSHEHTKLQIVFSKSTTILMD